jgi:predicted MFS family arabinose efflux permease
MRARLLGVAVGLALADSSIVTLALPEILGQFDVAITSVAWVLTSFNLVLAVLAVPAAYVSRRRPREAFVVGTLVFAGASLACGLAPSFDVLVAARCVQAVGAALLVTAALDLVWQIEGSDERALRIWVSAGVLGAALGPAAGGILTQLLGWEAIFLAQVPLALALLGASRHRLPRHVRDRARVGRPSFAANGALLLVAGGLVAALFLVVLLLVDGWGMSPAAAGVVVTVMPLVAIAVGRLRPRSLGAVQGVACGVLLLAGGLAALALMPRAGWAWTIPPQILVGAGLGLTVAGLTEYALRDRPDQVVHGGWTIAARHAGVVVGLVLLAPP